MTAEQLALDAAPTVHLDGRPPATPQQKWARFAADNPHARHEIRRTTRQLLDQDVAATIAVVWEELRYRVHTDGDPYRWDNSLRAPAAAWLRDRHPDLAVHMRTRRDRRGAA